MSTAIKCHERAKGILQLLRENGPLPFASLHSLLEPPIKKRRLRDSILRLIRRDFIERRNDGQFGGRQSFYQLKQSTSSREEIALYLDCSPDHLKQNFFRYREIYHNTYCASVSNELKRHFPGSTIIRDFEFDNNQLAKDILLYTGKPEDLLPDILLIHKVDGSNKPIAVAIEVEKTRKSDKRLIRKLRKYANESRVDGVVYACETPRVREILTTNYLDHVVSRVSRVKRYRDSFLTFSNVISNPKAGFRQLCNSSGQLYSTEDWLRLIAGVENNSSEENFPAGSALHG
jgi:hypothetical protein